jgi:hypothetical protein
VIRRDTSGLLTNIPQQQTVSFLHAEISIIKLDEYLQTVATVGMKKLMLCQSDDNLLEENSVDMHQKPRDILLQLSEETRHELRKKTRRNIRT